VDRELIRQNAVREFRLGNLAEAAELFGQAASEDDKGAEDYCNRGMILTKLGRLDEGVESFKKALAIRPRFFEAYYNLGIAYSELNSFADAVSAYQQAVILSPEKTVARNNLGNILCKMGRYEESIEVLRRAIAIEPRNADYFYNLGISLHFAKRIGEAREALERAIGINPDLIEAYTNLGAILLSEGELAGAKEVYRRALVRNPNAGMVRWNFSQVLLSLGEYEEGWREYDWRRRVPEFEPFKAEFGVPMWGGDELGERTVLLYGEQGFGDTIHFARYAALVAGRGGKVVLACQPKLLRLMKTLGRFEGFFSSADGLPRFDAHCPVPSLPMVLGMARPEDYRWTGAYLKSEAKDRLKFAREIGSAGGKMKVGVVWSGRAKPEGRSIPLQKLGELAHPKAQFYSLQVGEGASEAKRAPGGMNLIDATDRIGDFADTAGLIDQLDLVIGIDTAVVQLAGAMGKDVWTMLKRVPDWRWQMRGEGTAWYPTMRLFRQERDGDWGPVVREVGAALRERCEGR
jgi:tetratricopeptide (TPR) repeat protein